MDCARTNAWRLKREISYFGTSLTLKVWIGRQRKARLAGLEQNLVPLFYSTSMEAIMAVDASAGSQVVAIHANAPAERLFFAQYRCLMAGYSTRHPFCWDWAWDVLLRFAAPDSAMELYGKFHFFIRTLNEQASRSIGWRADVCRCLCRDEFLVLRLVAASQQDDFDEEFLAATGLLGTDQVHVLLMASRFLAQALKAQNFVLAPIERRLPASATMPHAPPVSTLQ